LKKGHDPDVAAATIGKADAIFEADVVSEDSFCID